MQRRPPYTISSVCREQRPRHDARPGSHFLLYLASHGGAGRASPPGMFTCVGLKLKALQNQRRVLRRAGAAPIMASGGGATSAFAALVLSSRPAQSLTRRSRTPPRHAPDLAVCCCQRRRQPSPLRPFLSSILFAPHHLVPGASGPPAGAHPGHQDGVCVSIVADFLHRAAAPRGAEHGEQHPRLRWMCPLAVLRRRRPGLWPPPHAALAALLWCDRHLGSFARPPCRHFAGRRLCPMFC